MSTNLNDLIKVSDRQPPSFQWFDLGQLVRNVCDSLQSRVSAHGIRVEIDIPKSTRLLADASMIQHVVLNLLLNAIDAMPESGHLLITSWSGPESLELEIADSGEGLRLPDKEQLFAASYTTKGTGRGQGLTVAQQIVELHGGHIEACDCPQGGAAFTIHLPHRTAKAAA